MASQRPKAEASSNPYVIEWYAFGTAKSGGPVRWIADGHRSITTGLKPFNKTQHLGLPWESRDVERVAMRMLVASSRVLRIVAQPHSLFIGLRGINRQLRYTPDTEAWVHPSVRDELAGGRPLFEIAAEPYRRAVKPAEAVPIIFEMKANSDLSLSDPSDQMKMEIVRLVYDLAGRDFHLLLQKDHIRTSFTDVLTRLEAAAHDRIGTQDKTRCSLVFGDRPSLPFGFLSQALGGRPLGERLVMALHFKSFVSIDLRSGIHPNAAVWLTSEG